MKIDDADRLFELSTKTMVGIDLVFAGYLLRLSQSNADELDCDLAQNVCNQYVEWLNLQNHYSKWLRGIGCTMGPFDWNGEPVISAVSELKKRHSIVWLSFDLPTALDLPNKANYLGRNPIELINDLRELCPDIQPALTEYLRRLSADKSSFIHQQTPASLETRIAQECHEVYLMIKERITTKHRWATLRVSLLVELFDVETGTINSWSKAGTHKKEWLEKNKDYGKYEVDLNHPEVIQKLNDNELVAEKIRAEHL